MLRRRINGRIIIIIKIIITFTLGNIIIIIIIILQYNPAIWLQDL